MIHFQKTRFWKSLSFKSYESFSRVEWKLKRTKKQNFDTKSKQFTVYLLRYLLDIGPNSIKGYNKKIFSVVPT